MCFHFEIFLFIFFCSVFPLASFDIIIYAMPHTSTNNEYHIVWKARMQENGMVVGVKRDKQQQCHVLHYYCNSQIMIERER